MPMSLFQRELLEIDTLQMETDAYLEQADKEDPGENKLAAQI